MLGPFNPKSSSHPPEHKIHQKLKIAIQLLEQRRNTLDYCQLIFLLTARRIPENLIRMFLTQIHKDSFYNILTAWQTALKSSKIVEDVFAVKRKMVEEQWVQANINERHHKHKQEQYQIYEEKVKSSEDVRKRIKSLKDQLGIVEGQIHMTRKDEESLKLREQYKTINEEYIFWRNRQRRMKQLSQQKAVNESCRNNQGAEVDLNGLFEAIQERYAEQVRLSNAKNMGYHEFTHLAQQMEKAQGYSNNRMKALEAMFSDYAKKEFKQSMLFDEISNSKDHLSLQNFLRFMTDGGIENHLTLEEKVKIFKERSQFDRKINFLIFTEILQDICNRQCQKLKLKYNSRILDIFVDQMISKIKQKNNPVAADFVQGGNVSPQRQYHTNNLRNKMVSNYQYRLRSHTGMYPQGIEENLKQRKKEKQIATEASLEAKNSRSAYNNKSLIKFIHKNRDKKTRLNTFDVDTSHLKDSEQKNSHPTISRYDENSTKKKNSFSHFQQKDSYSNMFYRKIANHLKHKRQETDFSKMSNLIVREHHVGESVQPALPRKDRYSGPIQLKVDTEIVKQRQKQQAKDALEVELQGMVKLEEEDFFLTSHLQGLDGKGESKTKNPFHY